MRRRLSDQDSYAAWKLDDFWHRLPVDDAAIGELAEAKDFPAEPKLIQADDGSPEIYIEDGTWRRHVADAGVMTAWGFDFGSLETRPAAEVASLNAGPDCPDRPRIVARSDGAIFALDVPLPELGAPPLADGGAGVDGDAKPRGSHPTSQNGAGSEDMSGGCGTTRERPRDASFCFLGLGLLLLAARR